MATRDIVVIGASAGGVHALHKLARGLPGDLEAAIFVVLHTSPGHKSMLPEILGSAGALPAAAAEDGWPIESGRIYIAPNDRHLLVEPGRVRVVFSPRENLFRPAIDPLFRTAAYAHGARVVGILLSGTLDDGCDGLAEIAERGGLTVVQEPSDAEFAQLPLNAIRRVPVDHVLLIKDIAVLLKREAASPVSAKEEISVPVETSDRRFDGITCPDCHGPIYGEHGSGLRFRCIEGTPTRPETMRIEHAKKLENALWSAIATFEEHATILRRLARETGADRDVEEEARQKEEYARELREFVAKVNGEGARE